jgi:hypothetical protein
MCPKIVACLLSPVLNHQIRNDSTIQEIQLDTDDDRCLFQNVISLGHGRLLDSKSLEIDRDFYLSISRELQIHEIAEGLLNDGVDVSDLGLGELLDRCENRSTYGLDCPAEIAAIAKNISMFDSDGRILTIPLNILESVLAHPELAVSGEDQLCAYLADRYKSDPDVLSLFQYIQFRYLSVSGVNTFIEAMGDSWRHMTDATWEQFCERARCAINYDFEADWTGNRYSGTNPAENETVLGLLARVHGNLNENKVVNVAASSQAENCSPRACLDFNNEQTVFISQDEPGQWICYDFMQSSVSPRSYLIQSGPWPEDSGHLMNWTVEGSNDGMNWDELDSRIDDGNLNGSGVVGEFDIADPGNDYYRYIRLRQDGLNHGFGHDQLTLSGFDIVGTLINCTDPAAGI